MKRFKTIRKKRIAKRVLKKEGRNIVWLKRRKCFRDLDRGTMVNDIQTVPPWERISFRSPEELEKDRTDAFGMRRERGLYRETSVTTN